MILLRFDNGAPRVLMGRRCAGHAFMPDKYVFPGGRRDAADCRIAPAGALHPDVEEKLLVRMKGKAGPARARGLAMAAVRETFEETGFILGRRMERARRSAHEGWRAFFAAGYAPDLAPLRYFARAITPPGMNRRFDARFFLAEASRLANPDRPLPPPTKELLDSRWLTLEETRRMELPRITRRILALLEDGLAEGREALFSPRRPVSFQYRMGKSWRFETI